jgi:oligopeptide transport system permease protein
MDTKDQRTDSTSPEMMLPDSTMRPPLPETAEMIEGTTIATLPTEPGEQKEKPSPTPLQDSLRRLRRDKRAMISLGLLVFFIVLAIVGPPIYQHIGGIYNSPENGPVPATVYHSYGHQELGSTDINPFTMSQYPFGTDDLGRDLLARLMQGLLISISVAILVEIVDIVLGILVGVLAGYYGGWIDQVLARFTDIMFAFPGLLFVILIAGILGGWADSTLSKIPIIGPGGNARLLLVAGAIALTTWPLMARYVRGQTLQLKEQQFIEAARTSGSTDSRIILRHIIPNLFSIVVVAATLDISNTIIGEAGISYLGLGVQPPGSSIGLMIADAANLIESNPWEVLFPSIVLALIVLAFSFLGDGLRDAFDPRSKD